MIQRCGWELDWSLLHLSTKPKVIKIKSVQVMLKVVCCQLIRRSWQVHTVIKAFISENVAQEWLIFESLELKEEFFPFILSWCRMKRTEKKTSEEHDWFVLSGCCHAREHLNSEQQAHEHDCWSLIWFIYDVISLKQQKSNKKPD